ncbi:MAG: methyltransferase domain-containing protein [Brevinema sp.]
MIEKKDLSVLLITQAGKKYGIGHLKRIMQIADFYTKPFIWIMTDLKDQQDLTDLLLSYNHHISHPSDKRSINDLFSELHFDLIISDCDTVTDSLVSTLNTCHISMISLDNTKLGACSEIYITPLPSYKRKKANFSEIYHSPINEKFFLAPPEKKIISKILISLGGSDPYNNAEKIVKSLKDQDYQITVIAGPLSNYRIEENNQVQIKYNVSDLFPYIKENDLIFCGPGLTLLESLAAKKHIVAVAHNFQQYQDLSRIPYIQTLLGSIFLRTASIKKAIAQSTSGRLSLPEGFNFQDWFLQLSDIVADRPASCPLCSSYHKYSLIRTLELNQFSCNHCSSSYIYKLSLDSHIQTDDTIVANNAEQEQISYKQAVLNLREDSNRRIQIIKKILPTPQNHIPYKLMDIGAEHGIFVQEANHNGFSAQGVELSVFARKIARDNHNINIIDSMEKIYENGPVNHIITIWKKLEYLENPTLYLKKISTLLPIGGLLAFRVPIVDSSLNKGFFRITEKGGKLLAEQTGFVVIHTTKYTNEQREKFLEFYCIKKSEPL